MKLLFSFFFLFLFFSLVSGLELTNVGDGYSVFNSNAVRFSSYLVNNSDILLFYSHRGYSGGSGNIIVPKYVSIQNVSIVLNGSAFESSSAINYEINSSYSSSSTQINVSFPLSNSTSLISTYLNGSFSGSSWLVVSVFNHNTSSFDEVLNCFDYCSPDDFNRSVSVSSNHLDNGFVNFSFADIGSSSIDMNGLSFAWSEFSSSSSITNVNMTLSYLNFTQTYYISNSSNFTYSNDSDLSSFFENLPPHSSESVSVGVSFSGVGLGFVNVDSFSLNYTPNLVGGAFAPIFFGNDSLLSVVLGGGDINEIAQIYNPSMYPLLLVSFEELFLFDDFKDFPSSFFNFSSVFFRYIFRQPASLVDLEVS